MLMVKSRARLGRRELFGLGGLAAASVALPPSLAAVEMPVVDASSASESENEGSVMTTLSTYMSEASARALPEEVAEKTKRHVLDTFAAMISGSELPPGRSALAFAKDYGGKKVATGVSSKILWGPIEAALTNAMLAHSDETDDSHPGSQSHPGCAVIPAALAVGELFGISGSHFLRAVSLGYDVGTRFTIIVGERYESETHRSTHSIAPLFGAAAAAGCAAGLQAGQVRRLRCHDAQQR